MAIINYDKKMVDKYKFGNAPKTVNLPQPKNPLSSINNIKIDPLNLGGQGGYNSFGFKQDLIKPKLPQAEFRNMTPFVKKDIQNRDDEWGNSPFATMNNSDIALRYGKMTENDRQTLPESVRIKASQILDNEIANNRNTDVGKTGSFGAGMTSGLDTYTLGIAGAVKRAINPVEARQIELNQLDNPTATNVGMVAGWLVPGGATGLATKGAETLLKPVTNIVGKGVGSVIGKLTGKTATELANSRIANIVTQGAIKGTEGAITGYGTGAIAGGTRSALEGNNLPKIIGDANKEGINFGVGNAIAGGVLGGFKGNGIFKNEVNPLLQLDKRYAAINDNLNRPLPPKQGQFPNGVKYKNLVDTAPKVETPVITPIVEDITTKKVYEPQYNKDVWLGSFGKVKATPSLKALVDEKGIYNVEQLAKLSNNEIKGIINQEFPNVDLSTANSKFQLLDVYGNEVIKNKGYDAIVKKGEKTIILNPNNKLPMPQNNPTNEINPNMGKLPPKPLNVPQTNNIVSDVPTNVDMPNRKTSKLFNSIQKSKDVRPIVKEMATENNFYYEPITNKETIAIADNNVLNSADGTMNKFLSADGKNADVSTSADGFALLKHYQSNGDYDNTLRVIRKLREIGTSAGQQVQIYSILSRLTPDGMVKYAQNELDTAFEEILKKKGTEWGTKNQSKFTLTPDEVNKINNNMKVVETLPDGNRQKQILLGEVQKIVKEKVPATLNQQFKATQRVGMLLNPKTILSRNAGANAIFNPVLSVKETFGAGIDKIASNLSGLNRTTGLPNYKAQGQGMKKGIIEAWQDAKLGIDTRSNGGDRFEIGQGTTFKSKYNPMRYLEKSVNFALDAGDRPFYEGYFKESLENQMKLNKVSEPTQEMVDIATDIAEQKTWADTNRYTKGITNLRNGLNVIPVAKGVGAGDIILPFTKTPANLAKAMVEYSPVGLTKALLYDIGKFTSSVKNGTATAQMQRNMVDNLAKGITGTLLYVIGAELAKKGITTGTDNEKDKDVRDFKRNTLGINPYSIKVGDKTFTYDWSQPLASSLSVPADVVNGKKAELGNNAIDLIVNAFAQGGNSMFEQSVFRGIKGLFGQGGFAEALSKSVVETPLQLMPSFVKQIADYTDDTVRNTSGSGTLDTVGNKIKARLPIVNKTLNPIVDTLGKDVKRYGGDNSAFNVFLNPANVNSAKPTPVTEEIYRVYQQAGDKDIFPKKAPVNVTYEGKTFNLDNNQSTEYQRNMGQFVEREINRIINSAEYKRLPDNLKSETLKSIVTQSSEVAKSNFLRQQGIKVKPTLPKNYVQTVIKNNENKRDKPKF